MPTQIRGNVQIMPGTITADRLASGLNLATSQLAEGASFLKRDGSVQMTGALNLGGFKVVNQAEPTAAQDSATKNYVDTNIATVNGAMLRRDGTIAMTGALNMGNQRIISVADPINPQDVATKAYVDLVAQGLDAKNAVRAATTGNISLTGTQTIDGVALSAGDRVLVKNQTTPSQNGIYLVSASAWARSTDADTASDLHGGTFVFVNEGTTQADTGWVVTTDGAVTLGTTAINWVQFSSAGVITAGNGLTKSGNTLSILLPANSGLAVSGAGIQVALDGSTLTKTATGLKISDLGAGKVLLGNTSGAATATTISGDVTIDANGVATVLNVIKAANYVTGEIPAGTINGSNATFTLANTPVANSEVLYYNGTRLLRGSGEDYTISGTTITMLSYIPSTGDKIVVDYIR